MSVAGVRVVEFDPKPASALLFSSRHYQRVADLTLGLNDSLTLE